MTEVNVTAARRQYSRALLSLHGVLNGSDSELKTSIETLAATKMLLALEVSGWRSTIRKYLQYQTFLGTQANSWVPHSRGLVNLIATRGPRAVSNEMSYSLLYSALAHDVCIILG